MKKLRVGLLGVAHFHSNFWIDAFKECSEVDFVGLWDKNPSMGKLSTEEHETRYYPNLEELLKRVDAVGITSETAYHADLVESAAAAGVHILLEKPMATNLIECGRIYRAVKKSGITFMQNFPKRYDPINHSLKTILDGGELGDIFLARFRHSNAILLELGDQVHSSWFTQPALSGGGILIDEGVHVLDLMVWLIGRPFRVHASLSSATLDLKVEDTALAVFEFSNGTIAEVVTSSTISAAQDSVELYGRNGTAIISGVDLSSKSLARQPYLRIHRRNDSPDEWVGIDTFTRFNQKDFHHQGPMHFVNCLLHGEQPNLSVEEGWKSIALVMAAYQSARTDQTVDINYQLPI